jgi:DNA-binding transcriptional ArsR family regulator
MDATIFNALADPNRLRIIELLRNGPRAVGDIAKELILGQSLVSSHLKVLSKVGFVKAQPIAQKRLYELQAKPFEDLGSWTATFSQVWNTRFDVFEVQLERLKQEPHQQK